MKSLRFIAIAVAALAASCPGQEATVTRVFTDVDPVYFEKNGARLAPQGGWKDAPEIILWESLRSICVTGTSEHMDHLQRIVYGEPEQKIQLFVETIEVERADFNEWIYRNHIPSNATALRQLAQEWIEKKRAALLDITALTAENGQRAKSESITEYIYPTEMDPPEIPNDITLDGRNDLKVTPTSFTAFETRNLGTTFEVDPVIGADGVTIDLNLAPERVAHIGDTWWPSEDTDPFFRIRMPTFVTGKITTQATTHDGDYTLLGAYKPDPALESERKDPLILVFVRCDLGDDEGQASQITDK